MDVGEFITDEELARQARAGSSSAFDALAERFRGRVLQHLRGRTPRLQDREDLAQETFIRARQSLAQYDPARPFGPWLLTIASRLAVSRLRSARPASDVAALDLADDAADPGDAASRADLSEAIWARLADVLPPAQLDVVRLRYAHDLSVREIAQRTRRTQIHVRVLLHRARQRMLKSGALNEFRLDG